MTDNSWIKNKYEEMVFLNLTRIEGYVISLNRDKLGLLIDILHMRVPALGPEMLVL